MARSVDNIDLYTFIRNGHILCEDGDSPLPLKIVVVEDQFPEFFLFPCLTGLIDHPVHKGGLAVVNVSDNRYVPYVLHKPLYYRFKK